MHRAQTIQQIRTNYQNRFPKNDFSLIRQLQNFSRLLDNADLIIDQIINYGIVVYGQSRIGKTTSCQLLAGGTVKGIVKQGFKMVELASSRFEKAKIGNTPNSQTTIPNFLTFTLKDEQITIIDTPGYRNNGGLYKTISNAYFHNSVYSRVKNMKFVIAFEKKALTGTAEKFISTIGQFVSSFKDYDNVKQNIWESACFLFTKEDNQDQWFQKIVNSLKYLMQTLKIQDPKQQTIIKQITNYMITNKRIYTVRIPRQGQTMQCEHLLEDINTRVSTWYSRQIINDGYTEYVDMEKIAFNLGKQMAIAIDSSDHAKQQLRQLIQYYNMRIKQFFRTDDYGLGLSFYTIINQITYDAMNNDPNSHNFLNAMSAFTNYFYKKFDPALQTQRRIKSQALFQQQQQQNHGNNLQNNVDDENNRNRNYFLKLFRFLKKIQEIQIETTRTMPLSYINHYPMKSLKKLQKQLYQIIRQIHKIYFKKKQYESVIIKFGWILHRVIQESKVLLLLLQIQIDPQYIQHIFSVSNKYKNMAVTQYLYDFIDSKLIYRDQDKQIKQYDNLRKEFVLNFQINEETIKKLHLNCQLVDFFAFDQNQVNQKQKQILLLYSNQLIQNYQQRQPLTQQDHQILQRITDRLILARITTQRQIIFLNDDGKNKLIILIRKISKNLIDIYILRKMFQHALDMSKSIYFISSACRVYEQLIRLIRNARDKSRLQTKQTQFTRYKRDHVRINDIMIDYQDLFQTAQEIQKIQEIKEDIVKTSIQYINFDVYQSNSYLNDLRDGTYYKQLNLFNSFDYLNN